MFEYLGHHHEKIKLPFIRVRFSSYIPNRQPSPASFRPLRIQPYTRPVTHLLVVSCPLIIIFQVMVAQDIEFPSVVTVWWFPSMHCSLPRSRGIIGSVTHNDDS